MTRESPSTSPLHTVARMRRLAGILAVVAMALGATTAGVTAADVRACGSIGRPYPGMRYADTPLSKITASG
jgi:hypothetical protein